MKNDLSDFWKCNANYATDGLDIEVCTGRGDTPFNTLIDQCLFTMRVGEACEFLINADGSKFKDLEGFNGTEIAEDVLDGKSHDQDVSSADEKSDWRMSTDATSPKKARCGNETDTEPQTIKISLTLIAILEQGNNIFVMSPENILEIAQELKAKGGNLFKTNVIYSFELFSRALKYVICIDEGEDVAHELQEQVKLLKTQCYLNLSACQLQKGAHNPVIQNCTKALKLDPDNVKGLYRRAQAFSKTDQYGQALEDLEKALRLEPSNKLFQNLHGDILKKCQQQEQKLASAMSKMFNWVSE